MDFSLVKKTMQIKSNLSLFEELFSKTSNNKRSDILHKFLNKTSDHN